MVRTRDSGSEGLYKAEEGIGNDLHFPVCCVKPQADVQPFHTSVALP